jgi:ubiquinone/menaquinone biosynthesis C-methylase UbiE
MPLSIEDWHDRFCQQARWTESLRAHFLSRMDLGRLRRILEVGCGTGAVCASVARELPSAKVAGVDLNIRRLEFARSHDPACAYAAGDGTQLPFPARTFDLVFCHYLLLWIPSPAQALREMARVVRPGGWVIALAEPDHSARIDYPPPLDELGRLQTDALRRQDADPALGRRLASLFTDAGLNVEETGILGSQDIHSGRPDEDSELEWRILKEDVGPAVTSSGWERFRKADSAALARGERVLFVPTFYCFARQKN